MNKEITDEQLIEFIEGTHDQSIADQIQADADLKKRYDDLKAVIDLMENSEEVEVPSLIGTKLESAILQEELKNKNGRLPWMQIAASVALVLFGFLLGKWGNSNNGSELTALRQEVQSLREVTLTSTLQRHSASERIFAVNQIEEKSTVDEKLLSTLITTFNSDESTNVRYAALQALRKFINQNEVKAELVNSLESQSDPLIQISLIQILIEAQEKSAIAPLKDIIKQQEIAPEVRQQAEVALKVLT